MIRLGDNVVSDAVTVTLLMNARVLPDDNEKRSFGSDCVCNPVNDPATSSSSPMTVTSSRTSPVLGVSVLNSRQEMSDPWPTIAQTFMHSGPLLKLHLNRDSYAIEASLENLMAHGLANISGCGMLALQVGVQPENRVELSSPTQ
jgi:hypothetical protein